MTPLRLVVTAHIVGRVLSLDGPIASSRATRPWKQL